MTPEQLAAAEAMLARRPEFDWLTKSAEAWYTASQVAAGAGMSPVTVRKLCERGEIPGAVYYGPDIGWRMSRSGLVEYLAGALGRGRGSASSAG